MATQQLETAVSGDPLPPENVIGRLPLTRARIELLLILTNVPPGWVG
jgi:hypothetical protein